MLNIHISVALQWSSTSAQSHSKGALLSCKHLWLSCSTQLRYYVKFLLLNTVRRDFNNKTCDVESYIKYALTAFYPLIANK